MLALTQKEVRQLATTGMGKDTFLTHLDFGLDLETSLMLLEASGLSIIEKNSRFFFSTSQKSLDETTFCIVDIECNGSNYEKHQIIEIAAVKYLDGKAIDTFSSLIQTDELSHTIKELTGITLKELSIAPSLNDVMLSFRLFLADSVFVAHALKFDYEFVSAMFERVGLNKMLNRSVCTINLAERTFSSAKYGLKYLNETLFHDEAFQAHRALSDARLTTKLFDHILKNIQKKMENSEELIRFSHEAKKKPKAALISVEE